MNLRKKKELAARALNISRARIIFNTSRLEEIKNAITKQDIKDLLNSKAILIKEILGRKKVVKRNTRRKGGSIRKKHKKRKYEYMILTRKLRAYLSSLKKRGLIQKEQFLKLRKEIRASDFKSLAQMKEKMQEVKK